MMGYIENWPKKKMRQFFVRQHFPPKTWLLLLDLPVFFVLAWLSSHVSEASSHQTLRRRHQKLRQDNGAFLCPPINADNCSSAHYAQPWLEPTMSFGGRREEWRGNGGTTRVAPISVEKRDRSRQALDASRSLTDPSAVIFAAQHLVASCPSPHANSFHRN